jgi:hypothetical protein
MQECTFYQDGISNLEDLELIPIACNTVKKEALLRVKKGGHAGGERVHVCLHDVADAADAIKLKRAEMSPALTLANQ